MTLFYSKCRRVVWNGGWKDITVYHTGGESREILRKSAKSVALLSRHDQIVIDTRNAALPYDIIDVEIKEMILERLVPGMTLQGEAVDSDTSITLVDEDYTLVIDLV